MVWDTRVSGISFRSGTSSSHWDRASAPSNTKGRAHQPAMADTSGWVGVADDDNLPPLPLRLLHNPVDAGDVGAGGVNHRTAQPVQLPVNCPPFPVGSDNYRRTRRRLPRSLDQSHPQGAEVVRYAAVVYYTSSMAQGRPSAAACSARATARRTP